MVEQPQNGLVLVHASLEALFGAEKLSFIAGQLQEGTVVIIKGAVNQEQTVALRDQIVAWRRTLDVVDFSVNANAPGLNFHRVDAHPEKSLLPHLFHQHGFGDLPHLEPVLASQLMQIATPMLKLQNAIAGTDYRFDMPEVRIKALQYPSGGGFLMKHTHPIEPQRVGLILGLSQNGVDFECGGTSFVTPQGPVDTGPWHDAGDLILFRYDLEHAVGPVDPDDTLNWDSGAGRWTLVLELLGTHRRSEAA